MTDRELHVIDLVKKSRGPVLDPLWLPTCLLCGPLTDAPLDREDARTARDTHAADPMAGRR